MQANLVFSPFAKPCVPLGISLLKSYVQKNSDFKVKCFDLNVGYHNTIEEAVREGKIKFDSGEDDRLSFLNGLDVFKGKVDGFFDQKVYTESACNFKVRFDELNDQFHALCSKALFEGGPIPWFVREDADRLLANDPDVVGFSIMFDQQYYYSALLAGLLKSANENIKIVFGGNPCQVACKSFLTTTWFIDYVVLNEGETAFLGLLEALNGDKEVGEVGNLAYVKDGEVAINEPEMMGDLDEVPYGDFSDYDFNEYYDPSPVVSVLGSRGCYWRKCTFCTHHKSYFQKYRTVSVERVVDELEYHAGKGVRYFDLVDEMISAARFRRIGEEILRRGLDINYYALAKPTGDFTKEIFETMYASGCRYIIWGVESGSQRILDLIDKGTNVEEVSKVLEISSLAGLRNHVFIIVGFPSETKEELMDTLGFLYENKDSIDAIHMSSFTLGKGSAIYENPEKFSITKIYPSDSELKPFRYDVADGIKCEEARTFMSFFGRNYFLYFSYFSSGLPTFRNHGLIVYSHPERIAFTIPKVAAPLPAEVKVPW